MKSSTMTTAATWMTPVIAALGLATTVSAQITVPITNLQTGNSAAASPNAAYSNITNYLGTTIGGDSGGLSDALFSNLTAAPALQGQTVQSLRLGVTCAGLIGNDPIRSGRVQVGFWNADGPNGTAGTPVQGINGVAQYQTDVLSMPRFSQAILSISLGSSGFIIPSGRFYFGIAYDTREFSNSSGDFAFSLYDPPIVGTNQSGLHGALYPPNVPLYGIPWGTTFGAPNSPVFSSFIPGTSLGIELIVPAPSTVALLVVSGLASLRRCRS